MSLTTADVRTWVRAKMCERWRGDPRPVQFYADPELIAALYEEVVRASDNLGSDLWGLDRQLAVGGIPVVWMAEMPESPFLRAIAASPADDLPRLMFADWLDERGDYWVTLIRRQVAGERF